MSYKRITGIRDRGVFLDLRDQGFNTGGGGLLRDGNSFAFTFSSSREGGPAYDDKLGLRSYEVCSADEGKTWTEAVDTTPVHLLKSKDGADETLGVSRRLVTRQGTHLYSGIYHTAGQNKVMDGHKVRAYTAILGRQEKGATEVEYQLVESGTYLTEQFIENGVVLDSGRILLCLWGAGKPGENWQSGVLLSDDDGRTWRYRTVAYNDDLSLRDDPARPVGFNEQTHMLLPDGKLVVMFRAREGLGRTIPEAPKDTCYFCASTTDEGETWTDPEPTNLFGTGSSNNGVAFSDGSILMAARIPYYKEIYDLPDKALFGQHYARSLDGGRTWNTEHIIQSDIDGNQFDSHYSAGRGSFFITSRGTILHQYGFRDEKKKLFRILYTELEPSNGDVEITGRL
jgi:hypothetical protein